MLRNYFYTLLAVIAVCVLVASALFMPRLFIPSLWLLCGLAFSAGLWLLFWHYRFTKFGMRVQGRILRPRAINYSDDSTGYITVAEYTVDGKRYVVEGRSVSGSKIGHREGRAVWIYYLPAQPAQGRLIGWWEPLLFLIPIAFGVYLLLLLIFGKYDELTNRVNWSLSEPTLVNLQNAKA